MSATINIEIDNVLVPFALDFGTSYWSASQELPEGYFPIIAHHEGKRFELYSDGTFAEVER